MAASDLALPCGPEELGAWEQEDRGESEYGESEYGDVDGREDPETLWNTYLKGVRFHSSKNKSNKAKKAASHKEKCSSAKVEVAQAPPAEAEDSGNEDENEAEAEAPAEVADCQEESKPKREPAGDGPGRKKKPRMRTVSDVISRIQWDPDLPAEHFAVGYLDRFLGLMEKPFQYFSWEDLASVDYNVLAVPKHRIVYVKYRDRKVWDKNERLDLVFGSTEDPDEARTDIRELVQEVDAAHAQRAEAYANLDCGSDDDSDEDDVQIHIENMDRFSRRAAAPETGVGGTRRLPACRPNHFVAVRVTEPGVVAKAAEMKQHIISKDPRLFDFLMPDGALHITLAMLKLDDPGEIATAAEAIRCSRDKLTRFFDNPVPVELGGLATFNGYVLYVPVRAPPAFYELQKSLLERLKDSGVRLAHEFDFVPHMTLLKLTRSRARAFQSPYIDPYVYAEHKDSLLGTQLCDNLHLCVIGEEKRWDGFYNCAAEVHFT